MSKTLIYETSNLYIQDGCIPEFVVGQDTNFSVEAHLLDKIVPIETSKIQLHYIKDAIYEVVGFVYTKANGNAFIDFGMFKAFMTDNEVLEIGKYFQATVKFDYDLWNYFNLYVDPRNEGYKYYEEIKQTGKIVSITVDTSLYIPYKYPRSFTKEGVERKFDIKIDQTNCWDDESNYSNGSINYLIEVELRECLKH